jgi:hypothetical protein
MATAAVQIPSYNRREPGSSQLIPAVYPDVNAPPTANVDNVASDWVEALNKTLLLGQNYDGIHQLFLPGGCWRDQLGLSWDYVPHPQ